MGKGGKIVNMKKIQNLSKKSPKHIQQIMLNNYSQFCFVLFTV